MFERITREAIPCRMQAIVEALEGRRLLSGDEPLATALGTNEPTKGTTSVSASLPTAVNRDGHKIVSLTNARERQAPVRLEGFRVYSALRSPNVPDVIAAGLEPIKVSYTDIYALDAKGKPDQSRLDEGRVRLRAREAAAAGVSWVLDIEHWPTDVRNDSPEAVRVTMRRIEQLIEWARDERPGLKIGFYGMFPLRNYNTPVKLAHLDELDRTNPDYDKDGALRARLNEDFRRWQTANNFLKPLAQLADFIVPSLYTFYDSPRDWDVYAEANIAEARRYGKPVVPFLWSRYHESSASEAETLIAGSFFRRQLDLTRRLADSVVIWGAAGTGVDESEPWWRETVDFVASLDDGDGGANK